MGRNSRVVSKDTDDNILELLEKLTVFACVKDDDRILKLDLGRLDTLGIHISCKHRQSIIISENTLLSELESIEDTADPVMHFVSRYVISSNME